ncbi:outer membrane protein assembly factor BamB family protein [Anatilimnocola floriformis]|uniref:outer membrane protein assembly factor BamB family protein n=1 Tax=Anatilimnocola floriformis TaxID=2948575 RepID=UPI0020C4B69C|nr:PQQ-binding-like beta-propeller repeat protein [Anatilimnocola floriformis]
MRLSLFLPSLLLIAQLAAAQETKTSKVQEVAKPLSEFPALPAVVARNGDWPWWRGPTLDNHSPSNSEYPELTAANIRYRVEIPGKGHASPILVGEHVVLATADDANQTQSLLARKRTTGELVWQTEIHRGGFQKDSHRNNSRASATPAFDGQHYFTVFINHGGLWVSAVDEKGKIAWQTRAGDFDSIYGFGMAPCLWGPLVFVCGDNDRPGAFLAALHRQTGEIVWRVKRPHIDTYGTPIVVNLAGRDQLLLGGGGYMMSYDPATGKILWKCKGPTEETTSNTAAFFKDTVYVTGGYPKPYIAMGIRADGTGDVDDTHVLWTNKRAMSYVPSPLYHEGLLYVLNDDGIITCLDAETGKPAFSQRLGGDYSASPLLLGDRIVLCSEQGLIITIATGKKFKKLSELDLEIENGMWATPAVSADGVYVRTLKQLVKFGK